MSSKPMHAGDRAPHTTSAPAAAAPVVVWLRADLRLHDHEPLHAALATGAPVLLVYCLDPRHFAPLAIGVPKTGSFRARFLLESLTALRVACRTRGGELVVRRGAPEDVLPPLLAELGAERVHFHADSAPEEAAVEARLARALADRSRAGAAPVRLVPFAGGTMVHRDDLPFDVSELPDVFTPYRNAVERHATIRDPLPAPARLHAVDVVPGDIPTVSELGLTLPDDDPRALVHFAGGEEAGVRRLQQWMWDADRLRRYKTTRNGLLAVDDSSKLSPWLALGCLSPRLVHAEVRRYERERERSAETDWLVFELHWRDYFRWIAEKWGARLFARGGLAGLPFRWRTLDDADAREHFARWCDGTTGYPLVDAAMQELRATGYMSNRARQNVASFCTRVLGLDWRLGAAWFESWLVDYDVASNWGNWAYVSGVGNDARGFRFFNIHKQAGDYDPEGEYVRHWLPALRSVSGGRVHRVDRLGARERAALIDGAGAAYPEPIVELFAAAEENAERYRRAAATLAPAARVTAQRRR